MNVYCPSSEPNSCNIRGSLCNDLDITITDWSFDPDYLNINECVTNSEHNDGVSVSCNGQYSKVELFHNTETSQIECKYNNDKYCCPFRTNDIDSSCSNMVDGKCNVFCDFTNDLDGCSDRVLTSYDDETDLNVECSRYGSCDNLIVECPLNADCTFLCSSHESCHSVRIISENEGTSTVNITCVDHGGGYDVCIGAIIQTPKVCVV